MLQVHWPNKRNERKTIGSSRHYLRIIVARDNADVYVYAGKIAAGSSVEADQRRAEGTVSENGTNHEMK